MTSENPGSDVDELISQVQQLPPEERKQFLSRLNEEPRPPLAGWASNPLKTKATLRHLVENGECSREELADFLGSLDELGDVTSMNFGLAGRKSNDLFLVEKGSSKADDILSLSPVGLEVAEMFDSDLTGLSPAEKALYRGLHMYGHYVAFLGELERHKRSDGHEDGILKSDLVDAIEPYYGNEADAFVGYCGTLCERLQLIERTRDGNQMRYKLTLPKEWNTTG